MSTADNRTEASDNTTASVGYDVFVNDPPPQDGFLPNGEPKRFSPSASTHSYAIALGASTQYR